MKNPKGFTLGEVLIVLIILAILAAIFLPRILGQAENAYIAEAQQTLGILHKAIANALDLGLELPALSAEDTQATMPLLGLKGIPAKNFTYTCEAEGVSCTAWRNDDGGSITMDIAGVFTCDEVKYTAVDDNKGCRPKS